ncbi:hypothetical protein ASC77_24850 [Nocardioides sp. Root1257]|nr:hypothetical protein ASC77_24850 [Nocardioides sp. Root1257]KRC54657.1 hypothetical protein ASE24_24640 [Nocardioides sp. Root224]
MSPSTRPTDRVTTVAVAAVSCVGGIVVLWWLLPVLGADGVASWTLSMLGIAIGFSLAIGDRTRPAGVGLVIGFGLLALGEVVVFLAFLTWLGAHTA